MVELKNARERDLTGVKLILDAVGDYDLLTKEDEIELSKLKDAGDKDAYDKLVYSNMRLVVKLARRFKGMGVDYEDLIQEGLMGLMHGVKKYDYTTGYRISTYVTYWITNYLQLVIYNTSRSIRLPVHVVEELRRYKKVVDRLTDIKEEEPTKSEIAEELGCTVERVEELEEFGAVTLSLDKSHKSVEEGTDLINYIVGDREKEPENVCVEQSVRDGIDEILSELTLREEIVIRKRFGLDGEEVMTLASIGKMYGLSRERVRQIEATALRKLKNPHTLSEWKKIM